MDSHELIRIGLIGHGPQGSHLGLRKSELALLESSLAARAAHAESPQELILRGVLSSTPVSSNQGRNQNVGPTESA